MVDRPILIFPEFTRADRLPMRGGGDKLRVPPRTEQRRLDGRFREISQSFRGLTTTVEGLDPQQVVVFEVAFAEIPALMDVAKAVSKLPGLEWLAEFDLEDVDPDSNFGFETDAEQQVPRRLYAVMANQEAMGHILVLWNSWRKQPGAGRASRGVGPFWQLFKHLRDVRQWGPQDRLLDTRVEDWWEDRLLANGPIRFEAELWFRTSHEARRRAVERIVGVIHKEGGRLIAESAIDPIAYHGVLLECPPQTIRQTLDLLHRGSYAELLRCEEVMFYRPLGQSTIRLNDQVGLSEEVSATDAPLPEGEPLVGILDGLPLENHRALAGRLKIDDPDSFSESYLPEQQQHGTAMASLMIYGDLNAKEAPSARPVYVRPVMVPVDQGSGVYETFPPDRLFVDLFHRAVRRIVDPDEPNGPAAASVRIINVSLGNPWQPFIREMSPLAKLIDWLAWKYKLLFVISAGNHEHDIELQVPRRDLPNISDEQVVRQAIQAVIRSAYLRRLHSPAEAINAVTVGAYHADSCAQGPYGRQQDLLRGKTLPSLINPVASGFHRSVKPELLMPGGKQLYHEKIGGMDKPASFQISRFTSPPGLKVASPGTAPGELAGYAHVRGTSNAALLASRLAGQVYENLLLLGREPGADMLGDDNLQLVLTKALLVHGASWGEVGEPIGSLTAAAGNWQAQRQRKAQLLGYGYCQPERALVCSDQRVILMGGAYVADGGGHRYEVPLPPALSGKDIERRLTVTLAWLTPLNVKHRRYRRACLYLSPNIEKHGFVTATGEADPKLAGRGTVQHLVFEGQRSMVIEDDDRLAIQVNCKADAGGLEGAVPYGLAVTVEVAAPTGVAIYQEIRQRLRASIPVRTR